MRKLVVSKWRNCEYCKHSETMYEYNPEGKIIPESIEIICTLDNSIVNNTTNCIRWELNIPQEFTKEE